MLLIYLQLIQAGPGKWCAIKETLVLRVKGMECNGMGVNELID
jgi:hypothetical protein